MEPLKALELLKAGNKRYTSDSTEDNNRGSSRRAELTGSQHPHSVILSCADSRVAPELIFDTGIGDLFVLRVAGNVANTSTIASIEYAVAHLGTKLIVVMGHESCGAVNAAMASGNPGSQNLEHLVGFISEAVERVGTADINQVVRENARLNAHKLLENSEIIQKGVESENVEIVTAYYNLGTGVVDFNLETE